VIDGVSDAQLISYSRQDKAGPKQSDFSIARTEVSEFNLLVYTAVCIHLANGKKSSQMVY
jgi:hypothetical protein